MDHETWIISPITWTSILIFIIIPILCVFAGLDALFSFIHNHINIIAIVGIIISFVLAFITIIVFKKPLFLLTIPSNALALSQFLHMLINGSHTIYMMETMYLSGLWRLVVFAIWLVYMLLNLAVSLLGMGLGSLLSITNRRRKENDDSLVRASMVLCAIVGGIGWIINWIFL